MHIVMHILGAKDRALMAPRQSLKGTGEHDSDYIHTYY